MISIGELVARNARVHFIGICGTAMAAVAAELHRRGVSVSGSDAGVYPPMSTFLADAGVSVSEGFREENLEPPPDLVVVGNAVSRGNPEAEVVLDRGLTYLSLPELLRWAFLPGRTPIVVAGTHGKTTTSALIAWALRYAGMDPGWLVGGIPVDLGRGFSAGGGGPFVLEGDEYDTAFFDKRSKFIHYRPRVLVLNNLEFDHADIFDDIDALRRSFQHLLRTVPRSGLVVANADDPEVVALAADAPCPVITYSIRDAEAGWYGDPGPDRIRIRPPGGEPAEVRHALVGRHQGWNLLAAAAGAAAAGLPLDGFARAVEVFGGVKRRGELRGEARGVAVYDDFAHHPTAIRGTLDGFRDRFPDRTLWAVVEPRSNTMRSNVFQDALVPAFDSADRVCLRRVAGAVNPSAGDRLDVDRLAAAVCARGTPTEVFPDAGSIVGRVASLARPGDVVAVLSNGGFEGIHERILAALEGG